MLRGQNAPGGCVPGAPVQPVCRRCAATRGERFCAHHHLAKYTGVRCAGMRKNSNGQCRVWSGALYAQAAPLRRGSPYCHHHSVRCAGQTRAGARCTVTSSSEHEHAQPLCDGALYCAHHQPGGQPPLPELPPPSQEAPVPPPPATAAPAPPAISLAFSSSLQTPDGPLPPSILIGAKAAVLDNYVERLQEHFPQLHCSTIVHGDVQRSGWLLPFEGQTVETGTLASFMSSLGLSVEEVDVDESSDADSACESDVYDYY